MAGAVKAYFRDIWQNAKALVIGLGVTIKYFFRPNTVVTVMYPHEMDELPERHRGIHFLETDKCIMCHICAKAWISPTQTGWTVSSPGGPSSRPAQSAPKTALSRMPM